MPEVPVAQVVDRMTLDGYRDTFIAEAGGLRAAKAHCFHHPEEFDVERTRRFEGESDPADETLMMALRCPHGVRGTYVVSYGAAMDPVDALVVPHLADRR